MLEPRDRQLLLEALRPPEGFRFDQGFGTTYSLDLLALLTVPLAFTWFEQSDEDQAGALDSLEILESLRRYSDRLTIFCHAGRIAFAKTSYPQLAFVEKSIVQCQPQNGGAFHSKVWALRWVNDSDEVRYRLLCLSRNLGFSRAWDAVLALDGQFIPDRRSTVGRNRGLGEFVRALPGFAADQPVAPSLAERIELLAGELERTEFELPDGMTDLRFWPLGIGGKDRDPLEGAGARLLVISPFLTLGRIEDLADYRDEVTIVSTANTLSRLARRPRGIRHFHCLAERAAVQEQTDGDSVPESDVEAIELSDLHAKLYVGEQRGESRIWIGSANATSAAFERNVEFLVELAGPRKHFGIDRLMEPVKGELRFVNLLVDAKRFVASEAPDAAIEALEDRLEAIRSLIAGAHLEIVVDSVQPDTFDLEILCRAGGPIAIDSGIQARCWPVTLPQGAGRPFNVLEPDKAIARFAGGTFQSITAFVAFELSGSAAGQTRQIRFVLNLPLNGAPDDRRERILHSLVRDQTRFMKYLWLLLADEGVGVPSPLRRTDPSSSNGGARSAFLGSGLFEMLLRNLDRAPERLDNLASFLKEVRRDDAGDSLLPEGFDAVWEPIWHLREIRRKAQQP